MAREQRSERMSESAVREHLVSLWPEIDGWAQRNATLWTPAPGSELAGDDAEMNPWPSSYARTTLGLGSEHLIVASAYFLNFGPTVFAMNTLLRTAMLGGAQAVWLLAPDDRAVRLARVRQLAQESHWNHWMWADGIKEPHPELVDAERLEEVRVVLAELKGDQRQSELFGGQLIRAAADYIYSSPPDPTITTECLAIWRTVSCVAHALPWELQTRSGHSTVMIGGLSRDITVATWADLQGALGFAYAFLETGWRLLDGRSAAAD